MTIVVTGRQRTLTWSGSLSGTYRQRNGSAPILDIDGNCVGRTTLPLNAYGAFSVSACGCTLTAGLGPDPNRVDTQVTADNGIDSDSDVVDHGAPNNWTISQSGSWSISADVEECYEVSLVDASLTDADGYPTFGGLALKDGPVARRIRFFERLRVGGTITATITSGSQTATATTVITAANRREAGYGMAISVQAGCVNESRAYSISGGAVGGGWGGPSYTRSEAVGGGTATATVTSVSDVLTATLQLDAANVLPCLDYSASGTVAASATRMSGYIVSGRALRWTDAYDGELTAHVKTTATTGVDVASDTSGQWAGYEVTHRTWSASSTLQGIAQTGESGGTPATSCRVHLTSASLAARGEDSRDWRLLVAGKPFRCLTVNHSSSSSLASLPANAEGYRYVRVEHRSVGAANQPWTLTIGPKSWNLQTGADGVTVTSDVDLCHPDNATATSDAKESRYPLDAPGGVPVDGPYWGVSNIAGLSYTKPVEVQVLSTTLHRQSAFARLSWAPALTPWIEAWSSPTDTTYHKPHGWSEVDGRVADIPSAFFVDVVAPGDYYAHQTIAQTATRLDGFGGWAAAAYGSWPDTYHNADRDSWWIGGTGHVWRGYPAGAWHSEIDREISGPTDVWGCGLWDEVEGYPGIGDAWERADYPTGSEPTRLPVRFSKIVRGQAWGIVLGPGGVAPASGDVVELRRESDDALRGDDTTDSRGSFKTDAPYGQGEIDHRVVVLGAAGLAVPVIVRNRMRHRRVFGKVAAQPLQVRMCRDEHLGFLHAVVPKGSGGLDLYSWNEFKAPDRIRRVTTAECYGASVGWSPESRLLVVVYEDAGDGNLKRTFTDSQGLTWSTPEMLWAGTGAGSVFDHSGREFLSYWEGGKFRLKYRRAEGQPWQGPFDIAASAVPGTTDIEVGPFAGAPLVVITCVALTDGTYEVRRYESTSAGRVWVETT